ncbi:hypothetical protein EC531_02340 [Helicobacter pylori]|nr:hypothetical protein EC531_02340 [Helicobacter pylori]
MHFLRLDSRELDFIQAVFFKAVFRDLGGILVVGGELFQNTPYFFKRMGLIKFKHTKFFIDLIHALHKRAKRHQFLIAVVKEMRVLLDSP